MPRSSDPRRPTPEQLAAAEGSRIHDVIGDGLRVLFCGINPSLYSGAVGHHFARPGNRFWKALHGSGFTDELVSPFDDESLLRYRLGLTNLVARATRSAADLSDAELRAGARRLERKARRHRPQLVAVLGIDAYRRAFVRRQVVLGPQREDLAGAKLWVVPNPSGLNAHFQLPALIEEFAMLRAAAFR